tara:strand:- start:54 stop:1067 length:1014 start_codon:yes stop_codon:yes gene_type:complete
MDPEIAHDLAIKSLKLNYLPESIFKVEDEEILKINLLNKTFSNPIGLAAGFDKSAEVYNSIYKLGFSFVEVGTVTPLGQYGNPKPRIFRLEKDEALINRLGFNNDGAEKVRERILKNKKKGILGVNIGPNKQTDSQENDFINCFKKLYDLADYITINISSPNTEKLRDFHEDKKLISLLKLINQEKNKSNLKIPIFLKVSPDVNDHSIEKISEIILENNISGVILTNTTNVSRENLLDHKKIEEGGLSGKPLENISNKIIKKFYKNLQNKAIIIGVGGVDSGKSAYKKITSGASLVQLYTGMIFKGPQIIKKIKKDLIISLKQEGVKNIKEIIGQEN